MEEAFMPVTRAKRPKSAKTQKQIRIGNRTLSLSNLGKVLYPSGFTKGQVLDYYAKISPAMLPHLKGRPLTLKRYPEGTDAGFFYEKQCPHYKPEWVKTLHIKSKSKEVDYCVVNELAALLWVVNLASLEFHTLLSREDPARPTMIAFDLDPGPGAGLVDCCRVAVRMRDVLRGMKLESFPKTSGGKGLHFYVPLNTPVTFDQTKNFARALALLLEREHPDKVTANMSKAVRPKKIFVDWSQNDDHKTTVTAYSLRAREHPWVSAPVRWQEIENCLSSGDESGLKFDSAQVVERFRRDGDLFEPVLKLRQKLPTVNQTLR
jgi:bifunctional non-homologous end joining protein LigD